MHYLPRGKDLHKFSDWKERASGDEPIEGEKASELLKEGLGGDWLRSRAWMGKSVLDKNLWGKKAWGSAHENQTLREFTLCDLDFLPAEREEQWLNSAFTETVGGSGYVMKRIREKSLLRKIKGLTGCPEGLLEVRHHNFVMEARFSTIMWGFPSRIRIFRNRSLGGLECSPVENLQGGQK